MIQEYCICIEEKCSIVPVIFSDAKTNRQHTKSGCTVYDLDELT